MSTAPSVGVQRILAGAPTPKLRVTLYDQDGDPAASVGSLTCTITRANGTVIETGRATSAGPVDGAYTCSLTTAEGSTLDVLTATWLDGSDVRATTYHRIVGGFIYSIRELAAMPGVASAHDDEQLRVERDRISDLIENATGLAWAPRYDRIEFEGHGHTRHALRYRPVTALREVTIGDASVTISDLDLNQTSGIISGVTFSGWCVIGCEHGPAGPPRDLRDAALVASADRLLRNRNALGPRVRSVTTEMGAVQQFGWAGPDHPTGLDEVDAVIMSYARASF